jgi:hypothetical protein
MDTILKVLGSIGLVGVILNYVKDLLITRNKNKRDITQEKLVKLYSKLYVIKLKYFRKLKLSVLSERVELEEESFDYISGFDIQNEEVWDKAIDEILEAVYDSVHLLEGKDFNAFKSALKYSAATENPDSESVFFDKYNSFKEFLIQIESTFLKLYDEYHLLKKEPTETDLLKEFGGKPKPKHLNVEDNI